MQAGNPLGTNDLTEAYSRKKTYIAADWDVDIRAVEQLYKWNEEEDWKLTLADGHDLSLTGNKSRNCNKKNSLKRRMDESCTFVLIVGEATKALEKGGCQDCGRFNVSTNRCAKGSPADYRSYLEYECSLAAKAFMEDKMDIVVLYNASAVDKSKCPESLRKLGRHANMRKRGGNERHWDYQSVKEALGK